MGFDRLIVSYIHHYSIIVNSVTTLNTSPGLHLCNNALPPYSPNNILSSFACCLILNEHFIWFHFVSFLSISIWFINFFFFFSICSRVYNGQGGLACCDSWGHKELDTTERLKWTELNWTFKLDFPGGSVVKNLPANSGDTDLIPGLGRFLGEGNDSSLQYSCLGNPMDRGASWATVQGVIKSWTRLSD